MFKKLIVDSAEVKYFIVNTRGRIIESGDPNSDTWEDTHVCLDSLKVGCPPEISFNKTEYRKRGRDGVWTELNFNVVSIEDIKPVS